MSPLGPGRAPNPDQPTEELPAAPLRPRPSPTRPSRAAERAHRFQAEYLRLAAAVREHRRASSSKAVAITAADRRLYARLERLEQPN